MLKLAVSAALYFGPTFGSFHSFFEALNAELVQTVAEMNSDYDRRVSALETELSSLARSAGSLNSGEISAPVTPMGELLFESRMLAWLFEEDKKLSEEMGNAIENMARYSPKETIVELNGRFLEKVKAAGLAAKVSILGNLIPRLEKKRDDALVADHEVEEEIESARTHFSKKKAEFENMITRLGYMRNALWRLRDPDTSSRNKAILSPGRTAYESDLRKIVHSIMTCAKSEVGYWNNQGIAWLYKLQDRKLSNPEIWNIARNVYYEDIQRDELRDEVEEADMAFRQMLSKRGNSRKLVRVTQDNLDDARTELTGVKMAIATQPGAFTREIVSGFDI